MNHYFHYLLIRWVFFSHNRWTASTKKCQKMYKVQADAIGCQKPAVLMSCYIKFWHLRHENVVDSARQMTETVNRLPEILHSVLQFDRSTNRLIFLALPLIFATTNACRFVWKTLQVKIKWNKKWISQSVHQFLHLKLKIWLYSRSTSHKNGLSPSNWSLLVFFLHLFCRNNVYFKGFLVKQTNNDFSPLVFI